MTQQTDRLNTALAGRYRIERELGVGGMATVYLAEDPKHHRKVAIKVLKQDLSASVGAARFLREIEIAAQLQHPNILPLLDSGEIAGILYYVMPYVEGQSLRQRLARERELPIGEAVRILVEVVDALAYAHQHGVVHRDMKPDNVMLSGRHALIADFGVARALIGATEESTLTSVGIALGTPTYMAPEQAVADPNVDQRADIYAVGVIAYELFAGRPPFVGLTPQQMLSAHVTERPEPLSKYRPGVSSTLQATVMRCIEKRPADRWQSADDLLAALEPLATPSGGSAPTVARLAALARPNRTAWVATASAVFLVAIVTGWLLLRSGTPALALGKQEQVTSESGLQIQPDISPDGKLIAYGSGNFARMRILIRPVSGGRTIPLSDDSTALESSPKWSPDGSRLLFLVKGGVSVAPALGGASRAVVPPSPMADVTSAVWSPDGKEIAFVRGDSLLRVSADGGTPRLLARVVDLHSCAWSPSGRWIACVMLNGEAVRMGSAFGNIAPSAIVAVPAEGGAPVTIAEQTAANLSPVWSPDGARLFFISNRDGARDIYAVDVTSSGHADGAAARLTTGLGAISVSVSVSRDGGRLAYAVYAARSNIWSLPVPQGAVVTADRATSVTSGSQVIEAMRISADGRWILYDSDMKGKAHAFRIATTGGEPEQLTNGPADEFLPDLSPDGRWVAYHSFRTGTRDIEVKPLDGGEVERVTATPAQERDPFWSLDGRSIVFYDQVAPFNAYVVTRVSPGKWSAPRLVATSALHPQWSPDGRSIAYVNASAELRGHIFIVPAEGGSPREVFAPAAGELAAKRVKWDRDGKTLYFKAHDFSGRASFWSIGVAGGRPRLLVRFDDLNRPSSRADFDTDGKRFYFAIDDRQSNVFMAEVVKK